MMKKIFIVLTALVCFANVIHAQDVKVSNAKLIIDGLLWLQYINTKTHTVDPFSMVDDTVIVNSFTRRAAFIGLTATLNSWASGRIYFDVASMSAYDLYVMYKPNSNLTFNFGQFKLPLGVEMLTKSDNLELIEYSLIGRTLRAPISTRDIGLQATYKYSYFDAYLACVNGNGRNVLLDDDGNKSIAGRLVIKPTQKVNQYIGANYYFGKYNDITDFSRFGAELNYTVNPFILKAELLMTKDDSQKGLGYYAQVGYNWMWLQPMFRYSTFKYESCNRQNELVFGLNFRPLSDNFKIMLNYKIEKTYFVETTTTQKGLLAQLQFAF
jgi:phosphate-selective porin